MSHYNGLIKCNNNKIFTDILINNGIISKEELDKNKDKLIMPIPFPSGYTTEDCINYRKNNARKLFEEGNYEQLMLETFAFLNNMCYNEKPNDILNIVCTGDYDENRQILYSCYTGNKIYYSSKDNKETIYFDDSDYKFYDSNNQKIQVVNFDDYDVIRVSYSYN